MVVRVVAPRTTDARRSRGVSTNIRRALASSPGALSRHHQAASVKEAVSRIGQRPARGQLSYLDRVCVSDGSGPLYAAAPVPRKNVRRAKLFDVAPSSMDIVSPH